MKSRLCFLALILALIVALLKKTFFSEPEKLPPPPPSDELFGEITPIKAQRIGLFGTKPTAKTNPGLVSIRSASFTYWYAKEDGLSIAESALILPSGVTVGAPTSTTLKQSCSYEPGFKISLGLESPKHWTLQAEYTYFRGSTTTNKAAPPNATDVDAIGIWNVDDWYLQLSPTSYQSLSGTYLSSKWKLSMDLGDFTVAGSYRKTRGMTFAPFGGLRLVWIRQHMNLYLTQDGYSVGGSNLLPPQPLQSLNSSNGWGFGPRIGIKGKYGFPLGLRLEGAVGSSLLYMRYTSVKHFEQKAATDLDFDRKATMNSYNCLRPVVDLDFKIGWGVRLYHKYSLDLSVGYDLSYFWSQNMMRTMLDEYFGATASGGLDLYFQGITFTTSFKF